MALAKLIATQLGNPSGIVGQFLAPLWNKRNAALNDAAFDLLALVSQDHVLEVGFGGGYLLGRMGAVVTDGFLAGVDVSPAMVAACEKRNRALVRAGRLELKCARAESLPFPSARFTKVCSVNSIFYWNDAPKALSECWRVLDDSGALVICFTSKKSLEMRGFAKHDITLYEEVQVQQMMESAGFRQIRSIRSSDRHREFYCMSGRKKITVEPT